MQKRNPSFLRTDLAGIGVSAILAFLLLVGVWRGLQARSATETAVAAPSSSVTDFGYGFNVAQWETSRLTAMGFNWIKLFDPPGTRLPQHVLYRVPANASHLNNLSGFGANVGSLAATYGDYIEAYEIGNEVNLDATYGWGYGSTNVPPNADDYVQLLCEAYGRIKAADPTAIVVSAGLAPTGRVNGNWNGHPGHNGLFQDDLEFFKEMVAAGGGACLDVVGYHPYGYSADYDVAPNSSSANPARHCANGFCFRGSELLYQEMQTAGLGHKKVWATEFGWITQPPDNCLTQPGWQGRAWQIVSEQKQADNLVGAFTYASSNYPWMGAMFVFNLNFNTAPWITDQCEQMRYYGVVGRPAEAALTNMPKVSTVPVGELSIAPTGWSRVVTPGQLPLMETAVFTVSNIGTQSLTFTAQPPSGASFTVTVSPSNATELDPAESAMVTVTIETAVLPTGNYPAPVMVESSSQGIIEQRQVPIHLTVLDQIMPHYLPLLFK